MSPISPTVPKGDKRHLDKSFGQDSGAQGEQERETSNAAVFKVQVHGWRMVQQGMGDIQKREVKQVDEIRDGPHENQNGKP